MTTALCRIRANAESLHNGAEICAEEACDKKYYTADFA